MTLFGEINFGKDGDISNICSKKVIEFLYESGSVFTSDLIDWYLLDSVGFFDEKCSNLSNLLNRYSKLLTKNEYTKSELAIIGEKCICLVLCGAVLNETLNEHIVPVDIKNMSSRGELYAYYIKHKVPGYRNIRKIAGEIYEWRI